MRLICGETGTTTSLFSFNFSDGTSYIPDLCSYTMSSSTGPSLLLGRSQKSRGPVGVRSVFTEQIPNPQPFSSPAQPPAQHGTNNNTHNQHESVDRYALWLNTYLSTIITVAIFGGQITFTLVVGQLAEPLPSSIFSLNTIRYLIAAAWLLFTATLGGGIITSLLFTDIADHHGAGDHQPQFSGWFGLVVSFLLNFSPIGAFLLLGLATVGYAPVVGWFGVAGVGGFAVLVGKYWLFGW